MPLIVDQTETPWMPTDTSISHSGSYYHSIFTSILCYFSPTTMRALGHAHTVNTLTHLLYPTTCTREVHMMTLILITSLIHKLLAGLLPVEYIPLVRAWGFPGGSAVKNHLPVQETWGWYLGLEDPLAKEMAAHSSILAWGIPCTAHGVIKSQTWLSHWIGAQIRTQGSKVTCRSYLRCYAINLLTTQILSFLFTFRFQGF